MKGSNFFRFDILILLLYKTSIVYATPIWHKIGDSSPDGSSIRSMAVSHGKTADSVYVGTDNGSVYYANQYMKFWINIGSGPIDPGFSINSIAFDNTTTYGTIYAGDRDGNVWYNNLNNLGWSKLAGGPPDISSDGYPRSVNSISLDNSVSPAVIYAGTASGKVWQATQSSKSWAKVCKTLPDQSPVSSMEFRPYYQPGYPAKLFVGTVAGNVWDIILNYSQTWSKAGGSAPGSPSNHSSGPIVSMVNTVGYGLLIATGNAMLFQLDGDSQDWESVQNNYKPFNSMISAVSEDFVGQYDGNVKLMCYNAWFDAIFYQYGNKPDKSEITSLIELNSDNKIFVSTDSGNVFDTTIDIDQCGYNEP